MWAVDDKATGAFVGQCGIRPVQEGAGPEIDLVDDQESGSGNGSRKPRCTDYDHPRSSLRGRTIMNSDHDAGASF